MRMRTEREGRTRLAGLQTLERRKPGAEGSGEGQEPMGRYVCSVWEMFGAKRPGGEMYRWGGNIVETGHENGEGDNY